jgi:hypothetical protein
MILRADRLGGVLAALFVTLPLAAAPKKHAPIPSGQVAFVAVPRIDVLFSARGTLVTTVVTFGRGTPKGPYDVFVAYGAPGIPKAFDAELVPLDPGRFVPEERAHGERLSANHRLSAGDPVALALGSVSSAGQRIAIPDALLDAAVRGPSGLCALRIRALHEDIEAGGFRSVLIRIAPERGPAPPLGSVHVRSDAEDARTSASLCRPGAPEVRLALSSTDDAPPPARAPRTPGESLCVRTSRSSRP